MCAHGDTRTIPIARYNEAGESVGQNFADVDACIVPIVAVLNIRNAPGTIASCCGHGYRPGRITLADGRELIIAADYETAQQIDALFPLDIHGRTLEEREAWAAENQT